MSCRTGSARPAADPRLLETITLPRAAILAPQVGGGAMIWNPEAETMAAAARRALQLERLRAALWAGARVPFYRNARRRRPHRGGSARPRSRRARVHREGAPAGPLSLGPVRGAAAAPRAGARLVRHQGQAHAGGVHPARSRGVARGHGTPLAAGGAEPGHLIQIAYGYGLFTGGLGFQRRGRAHGSHRGSRVVGNTMRQILLLRDFRPQALACTPSFALHIGETMRESGEDPRALGVRFGFFGAEPWTEAMRAQLEALWGFSALDFYGLSELIGPGVAVECLDGREGLHVNEDHFLPEVVDPPPARPWRPARKASWSSPRSPRKPCPCSATGPVTSRASTPSRAGAAGRRYAWRGSRGERRHAGDPWRQRLSVPGGGRAAHHGQLAPHYQLVVDRTQGFPRLAVHVEPAEATVRAWGGFDEALRDRRALTPGRRVFARPPGPQSRDQHRPA